MLIIRPQKIDLETATPGDPENCIFAKCIRRVLPTVRRIRIWRGVALLEDRTKKGETIARRYLISSKSKPAIVNFDKGVGENVSCVLLPPPPSCQLKTVRSKARETYDKRKERLEKTRKDTLAGIRKPNRSINHILDAGIRDGRGHTRTAYSEIIT
jgi:hypothetical protein